MPLTLQNTKKALSLPPRQQNSSGGVYVDKTPLLYINIGLRTACIVHCFKPVTNCLNNIITHRKCMYSPYYLLFGDRAAPLLLKRNLNPRTNGRKLSKTSFNSSFSPIHWNLWKEICQTVGLLNDIYGYLYLYIKVRMHATLYYRAEDMTVMIASVCGCSIMGPRYCEHMHTNVIDWWQWTWIMQT